MKTSSSHNYYCLTYNLHVLCQGKHIDITMHLIVAYTGDQSMLIQAILTLSLQITFQAVLSTDGQASFAAFTYSSPDNVLDITARWLIGFDAGDKVRGSVVLSRADSKWNGFGDVNIFRIDGKRKDTIQLRAENLG